MNLEMNKISVCKLFNIPVAAITMQQTIEIINKAIEVSQELQHVVVNAGKIVAMQKDEELRQSVLDADLINADGQAVVWASKFLGQPLPERVAGIDLMQNLVILAHEKGYKIFFFGAEEIVVKKVVEIYSKQYSPEIIAGYRNGFYKKEEEKNIAKQIADSRANILFVAISSPTKENFLSQNSDLLKRVHFTMGVGGSFDVVAGVVKRAPLWMQKAGLEWFYRFLQEPGRMWKRYLVTNSLFIWYVLKEKFKR